MGDTVVFVEREEDSSYDSLYMEREDSSTVLIEGTLAYESHQKPPLEVRMRQEEGNVPVYLFFALSILLLLSLVKSFFFQHILAAVVSVFNINLARKHLASKNVLQSRSRALLIFSFLFFFSFILADYLVKEGALLFMSDMFFFQVKLLLLLFLSLFLLFRQIALYFIGHLFLVEDIVQEYLFHTYSIFIVMGIVLIPLALLLPFVPETVQSALYYLTFLLLVLGGVALMFRLTVMILSKKFSFFYLILYLCTLEILPVLVIYKIVSGL